MDFKSIVDSNIEKIMEDHDFDHDPRTFNWDNYYKFRDNNSEMFSDDDYTTDEEFRHGTDDNESVNLKKDMLYFRAVDRIEFFDMYYDQINMYDEDFGFDSDKENYDEIVEHTYGAATQETCDEVEKDLLVEDLKVSTEKCKEVEKEEDLEASTEKSKEVEKEEDLEASTEKSKEVEKEEDLEASTEKSKEVEKEEDLEVSTEKCKEVEKEEDLE